MKKQIIALVVASALLTAGAVAAAQQTPPVRRIGYLSHVESYDLVFGFL